MSANLKNCLLNPVYRYPGKNKRRSFPAFFIQAGCVAILMICIKWAISRKSPFFICGQPNRKIVECSNRNCVAHVSGVFTANGHEYLSKNYYMSSYIKY